MPLKVTFDPNELEDFLRVEVGFDITVISMFVAMAVAEAETYLNTDFSTEITNSDETITVIKNEAPAPVKSWVLNRIGQLYENRGVYVEPSYSMLEQYRVYPFK